MNRPSRDLRVTRRMALESAGLPMLLPRLAFGQKQMPRPFHIEIPASTTKHILNRVREAKWPDRIASTDWSYGANWDYMKALSDYWTTKYDWRQAERG